VVPVVVLVDPAVARMVSVARPVRNRGHVVGENSTSLSPLIPPTPRAMLRCPRARSSSSVEFLHKSSRRS
jgi:hypothetical protein